MEELTPLAAFQALAITFAVAIVIDARKYPQPWRYILYATAAVFALIGIFASKIGGQWPGTLLAMQELSTNPTTWLIAGTAFYFIVRPYWKRDQTHPSVSEEPDTSHLVSRDELDIAMKECKRAFAETLDHVAERLGKAESSLSETGKQLALHNKFADEIVGKYGEADKEIDKLLEETGNIKKGCFDLANRVDEEQRLTNERLHAIYMRKVLGLFEKEMIVLEADLMCPKTNGIDLDEEGWRSWLQHFAKWESLLDRWLDNSRWYVFDPKLRVRTIKDSKYDDDVGVKDSQFPDANAVQKFKRFIIWRRQWNLALDDLEKGIDSFVYIGHPLKEVIEYSKAEYHQQVRNGDI